MYSSKSKDKKQKSNIKDKKSSFVTKPKIYYNSFHNCHNTNTLITTTTTTTTINGNTNTNNNNTNNNNANTNNSNELNYEILLNKLLKHLKKVLHDTQYTEIKKYISQEILNSKSSRILHKNESISSILKDKSNTTSTVDRASSPSNYSSNQMHSLNYSNDFKGNNHNSYKYKTKNEKKLKLSYDFSNILTSPKPKPIKIEISNMKIKQFHNNNTNNTNKTNTTPIMQNKNKINQYITTDTMSISSKTKNLINISNSNKDSHSLYTIIKSQGYSRRKRPPSNTHNLNSSNHSNSQSRLNTVSRDCSLNNLNSKVIVNGCSNTNTINNEGNSSHSRYSCKKVKQTLITKSQPFLNEKLFTKLHLNINSNKIKNNKTNNKINKHVCQRNPSESHQRNSSKKNNNNNTYITNNSKINNSIKRTSSKKKRKNVEKEINILYCHPKKERDHNYSAKVKKNEKKNLYIKPPQQIILNTENKQIKENVEMMKQIKNTLDDNLKVIFNFSYEDFLSKESETESKKSSRLETLVN